MLELDVCAAVIIRNGRFLLATRPDNTHLAGHWEFPGGKQEIDETLEECIIREIHEELHLEVFSASHITTVTHHYPEKIIHLHFMHCKIDNNHHPVPQENQKTEWYSPQELPQCHLAPADRAYIDSYDLSSLL